MNLTLILITLAVVAFVAVVALGFWISKCPGCGFYRDPEMPGCNCPGGWDRD